VSSGGVLVVFPHLIPQRAIIVGDEVEMGIECAPLLDGRISLQLFAVAAWCAADHSISLRRLSGTNSAPREAEVSGASVWGLMLLSSRPLSSRFNYRWTVPARGAIVRRRRVLVIHGSYQGIEIEMELHQLEHWGWRCDYTLIRRPERTTTFHHGNDDFPTMELAREYAFDDARAAIDQATKNLHRKGTRFSIGEENANSRVPNKPRRAKRKICQRRMLAGGI